MSLKMVRRGVASALGIAAVLLAGVACAQEEGEAAAEEAPVAPKGKREALQLTLTGSLLEYQKQTLKPDPVSGSSTQPAEQESSTTTFGVLGSGYGVGVGYLWDDVLLGARAQLTSSTHSPSGGGEEKTTTIDFFPRVEYVLDGGSARPFIAGLVGIQHAFSSTDSTTALGGGDSLTTHSESSFTRFGFGAAFGVHAFLNQSVSIDPEFAVLYAAGSGTSKLSGTGDGALPSSATFSSDFSLSSLRFLFTLGLSGWIDTGGAPPALPPREETSAAPALVAAPAAPPEPEAQPLSADIHLPNHRRLYVQVLKDPSQPSVLVRLNEARTTFTLLKCDDVSIASNGAPIALAIRSHGEHYLTGRLPVRGLELLAGVVDSSISVCGEQWQLGQESREQIQSFLKERRELIGDGGDEAAPESNPTEPPPAPVEAAPVTPVAPVAPSAAPSTAPSAPNSTPASPKAPSAPKAPATPPPSNAFPTTPTPTPAPAKPAPAKK